MCAAGLPAAQAYTVTIQGTQRALFLQVGVGGMSGGSTFISGGTPADTPISNSENYINTNSVQVQNADIGTGVPQTLVSDSPVVRSAYDGFVVCGSGAGSGTGAFSTPDFTGRVYVAGLFRRGSSGTSPATLTVETPQNLQSITSNADTLPFSTIAWTSSGVTASGGSESPTTIPSGAFVGGTKQTLIAAVNDKTWFENCLTFRYLNERVVPAGIYKGQAKFTLSTP